MVVSRVRFHTRNFIPNNVHNKKIIIWRANINNKIIVYGSCGQIFYNSKIKKVFVICGSGILSIEKTTFDDGTNALGYLQKKNNQFFDKYLNG